MSSGPKAVGIPSPSPPRPEPRARGATGRGGHCHRRLNPPFALIQMALGCAGRFAGPMAGNRPLPATALASSESPSHAGAPQDRPRAAARDKRLRVRWSDDGSHLGACAAVVVPALVLVKMH